MDDSYLCFSPYDLERIDAGTFVSRIEFHESLGSTSDLAVELAASVGSGELPLLVLTNQQTAGRGRGSNRWIAEAGGLTFSLVIDAGRYASAGQDRPRVSLAVALALRDALAELAPSAAFHLKWPNDVYASLPGERPRKIAGILLDCPPVPGERVVIGVGVNVNNSHAAAPEEIRRRAISLYELFGEQRSLCEVLLATLRELEVILEMLASGPLPLAELWQPHCLLSGREVTADTGVRRVSGICAGIDADGALLLRSAEGIERIVSATIEHDPTPR